MAFHVSPAGSDDNPGTRQRPFATLPRARDAVRAVLRSQLQPGPMVVEIAAGTYQLRQPLELSEADSGRPGFPVEYRAAPEAEVRIQGCRPITQWEPVTDAAVLSRLQPAARGKVYQADMAAHGVTDLQGINGPKSYQSDPGLEVFYRDQAMTLARYPNKGWLRLDTVLDADGQPAARDADTPTGAFICDDRRVAGWIDEPDVWLHGFWFRDWRDLRIPLGSVDPETNTIRFPAVGGHTYPVRQNQWFYAENLLCELDEPGEWYLDRDSGILYFWPPDSRAPDSVHVSVTRDLVQLRNVSHVAFRRLIFEAGRGTAVVAEGGTNLRVVACTFRNMGNWAVKVTGGTRHGVVGCDIYQTGQGGIHLEGGDRKTLTPAGHYADNNHIHHTSRWDPVYQQAIVLYGVGNSATHNLIDNVPHVAIGFSHNEMTIEYNEIHSSVFQSNDAGAIYTSPPDETWSMRGHRIRYNYLHNIHGFESRGCNGVYLDDCFSSADISHNIFYDVARPILIGGGRDNPVTNNMLIDCGQAFHIDARGLGWARAVGEFATKELHELNHTRPPWSVKYPELVGILEDDPLTPKGNSVARTICWGGPWGFTEAAAEPHVAFESNLVDTDPRFTGKPPESFELARDSPAWALGFQPIPLDRIGPYQSEDRASWPVTSVLRSDGDPG